MTLRRFSTSNITTGAKSHKMWDGETFPGYFESIATVTVGAGGSSFIEFTSIPSTYTHLQIRSSVQTNRGTFGTDYINAIINSDTGANYARHHLGGDGSTANTGATANATFLSAGVAGTPQGSTFASGILDLLDYANTNKYKTIKSLNGNDINGSIGGYPGELYFQSGLWMNTNAITSIKFTPAVGTLFTQYTKFALYGIRSA